MTCVICGKTWVTDNSVWEWGLCEKCSKKKKEVKNG
jgi:hypothetical protein